MTDQELVYESESEVKTILDVNRDAIKKAMQSPTYNLLQSAISKDLEIDKIEKYMALYREELARLAKLDFFQAMAEFQGACPELEKTQWNEYTNRLGQKVGYWSAPLSEIEKKTKAPLSSRGLSYRWETSRDNGLIVVTCVLSHSQGHSVSTQLDGAIDNSGNKNNIQGAGSTRTYLRRGTLECDLGLAATATGDDDGGGGPKDEIERISETQAADIQAMIDEFGAESKQVTVDWLYGKYEITNINMIPEHSYVDVINALERKREHDARR